METTRTERRTTRRTADKPSRRERLSDRPTSSRRAANAAAKSKDDYAYDYWADLDADDDSARQVARLTTYSWAVGLLAEEVYDRQLDVTGLDISYVAAGIASCSVTRRALGVGGDVIESLLSEVGVQDAATLAQLTSLLYAGLEDRYIG